MEPAPVTIFLRSNYGFRILALFPFIIFTFGAAGVEMVQDVTPSQQLKLSVNQSLFLNFTVPIKRAAVADEKVVGVSVVSPKQVLVTGKSFGFTQIMVWDEMQGQRLYDIRVDVDMARLAATIHDAAPRAKVVVTTILDTVVLSGAVPDAPTAERIVNLAKVFSSKVQNQMTIAGTHQVLLRATVAEVSRSTIRALGLNGTFFGSKVFGGSNVNSLNPTSIGLVEETLVPVGTPNQFQVTGGDIAVSSGTTLYFGLPKAQMELFLQAMQENDLIRVLAEPNLVAISGHEAEFLAGGELPIPTPNENGIAITFREYGIRLKFQPVVQDGEMIRMSVTSEVSEPDYTNAVEIEGYVVPGIQKRQAQTVIEVGSGQTFAIAGLLSDNVRGIANHVPGVGNIPVLGALFRSVRYERAETELLVMITPNLAAPLNPNEAVYVPGQDLTPPNDWQLYGLGILNGSDEKQCPTTNEPPQPEFAPPEPLCGPWGLETKPNKTQ
jgi:pilus assembly protein CpaC